MPPDQKKNLPIFEKVIPYLPQLIIIILLLWALYPYNPYGYYVFLRIVSFVIFGYLALKAYALEKQFWMWILIINAILYNPIIRIHLNREIWTVINILSIGISVFSIFSLKSNKY